MLQQYGQTRSPAARQLYCAQRGKSGGKTTLPTQSARNGASNGMVAAFVFWLVVGFMFVPAATHAQSGSLYGAGAPADAAFVRVFNNRSDGAVSRLWVGATEYRNLSPGHSSAYRPATPEIHTVYLNDLFQEFIPREGSYYTLLLLDDRLQIHQDPAHTRADLAQILVYNLDVSGPVSLRSTDGAITVIGDVKSGESGAIAVNPVAVELAVFVGDEKQVELGDIGLERGQSFAVFVVGAEGRPAARVERAEVLAE